MYVEICLKIKRDQLRRMFILLTKTAICVILIKIDK